MWVSLPPATQAFGQATHHGSSGVLQLGFYAAYAPVRYLTVLHGSAPPVWRSGAVKCRQIAYGRVCFLLRLSDSDSTRHATSLDGTPQLHSITLYLMHAAILYGFCQYCVAFAAVVILATQSWYSRHLALTVKCPECHDCVARHYPFWGCISASGTQEHRNTKKTQRTTRTQEQQTIQHKQHATPKENTEEKHKPRKTQIT